MEGWSARTIIYIMSQTPSRERTPSFYQGEGSLLETSQTFSYISLPRAKLYFSPPGSGLGQRSLRMKNLCHLGKRIWDFVSRENGRLTLSSTSATGIQTDSHGNAWIQAGSYDFNATSLATTHNYVKPPSIVALCQNWDTRMKTLIPQPQKFAVH